LRRVAPTLALLVAVGAAFVVPIAAPPPSKGSADTGQLERVGPAALVAAGVWVVLHVLAGPTAERPFP
jgi:hypothetical protein